MFPTQFFQINNLSKNNNLLKNTENLYNFI